MRLAYVTTYDASNIENWSGSAYHVAKSLEYQSISLEYVGSFLEYLTRQRQPALIACTVRGTRGGTRAFSH